jgi:hypothetical protein
MIRNSHYRDVGNTGHVWGRKETHSQFWLGNLKEKASTWKTCVNGNIIYLKNIEQEGVH